MAESAALLVDEALPPVPIRQWGLSFPYQLRLLLAQQPDMTGAAPLCHPQSAIFSTPLEAVCSTDFHVTTPMTVLAMEEQYP